MAIPRSTYRRIVEEEIAAVGLIMPGRDGKRWRREFVTECVRAGITPEGARSEARMLMQEKARDMVRANAAAGGNAMIVVWNPDGTECVGVPYRIEGNQAILEPEGLPLWAIQQVDEMFLSHGAIRPGATP